MTPHAPLRAVRSRPLPPPALLAGSLLLAALLSACAGEAAPTGMPPPPEVSVATVTPRAVAQWDGYSGRVAAVETVELRPRVSGYVQRVAYDEGALVRRGDLLFTIDDHRYRAALVQAEANLARARSESQLARSQDARAQVLLDAKAISREEFDARRASSAQGSAAVRAAEAAVAAARVDLADTRVHAPITGRAGRALVTAGNLAQADATVLTTLVSVDPVHVYFETDADTVRGARDGAAVRVGIADETGFPHAGTLDFADNQADARTGTLRARAVVPNPDGALTPGLFARVELEGAAPERALLVDERAVLTDQDRKYVYVLGAGGSGTRLVALGIDWSFLDVGRVRARIAAADAEAAGDLARYEQAVLGALEQTENALVTDARTREEAGAQQRAAQAAAAAARLARVRFDAGASGLLEVLDAERVQLAAEDAALDVRTRGVVASIDVYRALAGGWPDRGVDRVQVASRD